MTPRRWALLLLAFFATAADLRAQFGYGYFGGGVRFARVGRHGAFGLTLGGFRSGGYLFGPPVYPFYPVVNRVTVLYYVSPPPVVMLPPPDPLDFLPPDILPRNRVIAPPAPPADRGEPPPVPPPPPERVKPPPARKEAPKPPPKKEVPPAPPKEGKAKPKPRPRPPVPEAPLPENEQLLEKGREAFAMMEYGRAAERFRQSIARAPKVPLAYFLLAQALLALGKYDEAVDAIQDGMALRPDWPASGFRPLALYGLNPAEYPDHLRRLEAAVARHPKDPDLLFLYAYQLWFDGRKEEARLLFQRALPRAAKPEIIDRFLRAMPAAPVV